MRNWMSINLNRKYSDDFRRFLREKSIRYETSENGYLIHFEVLVSKDEEIECNDFLDALA